MLFSYTERKSLKVNTYWKISHIIDLDNGKAIVEVFPKGMDCAKTKTWIEYY